uniref:Uncharacterized protein n=1 Tax=Ditylenchus dipsaci TaxID=166011 RepID=A0A915EKI7_9BILA
MEVADKQSVANMVEKEKEEELPSFTPREAKDALTILQCYVRQNISNPNVLRSCDNIDKALVKERLKKMEQQ